VLFKIGRLRFTPSQWSGGNGADNPLLRAVWQLIERRQATVRPGEPPYRPLIRFLVHPDGLRTYFLAWPALESLHIPMSRQNVEPQDDAKKPLPVE
jgi:hypothetical protein